jgi:hypothetical protein
VLWTDKPPQACAPAEAYRCTEAQHHSEKHGNIPRARTVQRRAPAAVPSRRSEQPCQGYRQSEGSFLQIASMPAPGRLEIKRFRALNQ